MVAPIVSIVEGHGEIEAFPALIHRLAAEVSQTLIPKVNPPLRVKAGSFLTDTEYFKKFVSLAAAKAAQGDGLVVILLDCENDCPHRLGPELLARARAVRSDVRYLVALAYREFETWFLAAARSLRECEGLPRDLEPPSDPEAIRGAKEWLSARMPEGYDPVAHQVLLTRRFDFEEAQSIKSFRRLREKLNAHFSAITEAA